MIARVVRSAHCLRVLHATILLDDIGWAVSRSGNTGLTYHVGTPE